MAIPTSLLLKVFGGVAAAASVGTGIWWITSSSSMTKFDEALMAKLDKDGFAFTLNPESLTNTFTSAGATQEITVSYIVQDTEGKKPNSNQQWTWECKIGFKRATGASQTALKDDLKTKFDKFLTEIKKAAKESLDLKKRFIKNCFGSRGDVVNSLLDKQGNLDNVTTTISSTQAGQGNVAQENSKVKSEKIFDLIDEGTKLKPKEEGEFNSWFN